ncbi:unnamed protein product, partial [Phaeothamnion confervicola]
NRKCTDVLCLLLMVAAWGAMTIIGLIVTGVISNPNLEPGVPARLINGIDYQNRICGVDSGVKNLTVLYYLPSGDGVCIEDCPSQYNYTKFYCVESVMPTVYDSSTGTYDVVEGWAAVANGTCMYEIETIDILNYCVPKEAIDAADTAAGAGYTADLITARCYVFGFGIGVAGAAGFLFLILLRIPGVVCLLVWGCMVAIWALFALGGVVLQQTSEKWSSADEPHQYSESQINGVLYLAYVMYGLCGLWTLLALWLRKRINLAVGITKEAARAVSAMKLLILYPVIQTTGLLIFLVPWTIYCIYLASSGTITATTVAGISVKQFEYDDNIRYAGLYLLFCYFWTSEFIVAIGQIVVAMATATWYFTRDKGAIGNGTVLKAIRHSMWYHSGTAAFGALVIAIIKTIRAVVAYFQKKAANTHNKVLEMMLCCLQCCLWCLEKCMKFLNKNAYIQTAIFGYSFCKACRKAFFLILRNILRVAAVAGVSELVLLLGKIGIPLATSFMFYVCVNYAKGDDMHGLIGPTITVAILSFFVAKMFTEVFGMAISTILQCFIADEEMFEPADRFGEGGL